MDGREDASQQFAALAGGQAGRGGSMADVTIVGQGIFLRGSIRGEGDLEIRGRIEGDVEVGGEVTIADGALIKADVTARRITVRGAVAGNLTGEEGVRLEEGARVVGDVRGA